MDKEYNQLMDKYRDKYNVSVYFCPTCGFRGWGMSVTLHSHPVIRELKGTTHVKKND
jgi:hypothetical protein